MQIRSERSKASTAVPVPSLPAAMGPRQGNARAKSAALPALSLCFSRSPSLPPSPARARARSLCQAPPAHLSCVQDLFAIAPGLPFTPSHRAASSDEAAQLATATADATCTHAAAAQALSSKLPSVESHVPRGTGTRVLESTRVRCAPSSAMSSCSHSPKLLSSLPWPLRPCCARRTRTSRTVRHCGQPAWAPHPQATRCQWPAVPGVGTKNALAGSSCRRTLIRLQLCRHRPDATAECQCARARQSPWTARHMSRSATRSQPMTRGAQLRPTPRGASPRPGRPRPSRARVHAAC